MKVIFIKDLKNQGKVNDIKEVADGYAMNYLIKNKYAVKYTKESLNRLDKDLDNISKKKELDIANANKIKDKLSKVKIIFEVNTGKDGKVFGNISSKQICEELKNKGFDIDKKQIKLDIPLNSLGTFIVKIELYKGIIGEIKTELIKK